MKYERKYEQVLKWLLKYKKALAIRDYIRI